MIINLKESLKEIDKDTCCEYNLLTMYEACNLSNKEKAVLARMVYEHEDPEVIYDTLTSYFNSDCCDKEELEDCMYEIYDFIEDDDNLLIAKGINESTDDTEYLNLGKTNTKEIISVINNMLNNPKFKLTKKAKEKLCANSAPWGLAVQMVPSVDIDETNGLLATGDFSGEASFGESIDVAEHLMKLGKDKVPQITSKSKQMLEHVMSYSTQKDVQDYLSNLLDGNVEVDPINYNRDVGGKEYFTTGITFDEDVITGFVDEDATPIAYKLMEDGYLHINDYSDISVNLMGYESGVALDCYNTVPYDVDIEQLDKEADIIGNKIIDIIQSHEEDIYDILRQHYYEGYEDNEELSESLRDIEIDMWYNDPIDEIYKIDMSFSDADLEYRGNLYNKEGKAIGDFTTKDSVALYDAFPQFNWDAYFNKGKKMNENFTPAKKREIKKKLQDELYTAFINLAKSPEWGYDNVGEIEEFLMPIVDVDDYTEDDTYDIVAEFRAEVNYREMEDMCNTLDKVVKTYDKNAYFEPVQPGIAVAYLKFPKKLKEDFEDDEIVTGEQEFDSAATSINSSKLPAVYRMVDFTPGQVVIDFGGGKFDNAVNYLKDKDVTLLVYDPYNRSAQHNKEVLRVIRENGGADAAINSNVLNVIKEPEARQQVLKNIKKLVKPGAPIYITVYEGTGKGNEGSTKAGYQLNRKTSGYMDEISQIFPNVKRRGKLITAINESIGPKADKLRELIDEGVISKDLVVDEFINYLSEDDIADFLNQYDLDELEESSYGGAFDIEDDQYFTKEEIVEVAEKVCEHLDETYPDKFDISDVYMETPTIIHVEVISKEGNWASANAKIDMRKIKKPNDIFKYDVVIGTLVSNLRKELSELYESSNINRGRKKY